jgi:ABC-2 type transport system ATP-binding protein
MMATMTMTSNGDAQTAISAERLVRKFAAQTAVDEVDLEIRRGEIYGFLGPNGAGKSTTVRMLCTLLAPTAGRAVVAGYDVASDPEKVRLRIGVALQDAALDPKQTGIELLRLQGRLYGLSRTEIEQRLAELGALIDIGDALGRRIGTYSGGMKRRLDLAAALVHNPEVLFLDEPTSGLDPVSRARMWEEVRRLNQELNMTIFLTTQYLEEADELADRVGIINDGRLVAEGTPDALKRSVGNDVIIVRLDGRAEASRSAVEALPGVRSVEARGDQMIITATDGAATIGAVAVALNTLTPVRHLTLRTPTLDDVFLELTGNHIESDERGAGDSTPRELMEVGQ